MEGTLDLILSARGSHKVERNKGFVLCFGDSEQLVDDSVTYGNGKIHEEMD